MLYRGTWQWITDYVNRIATYVAIIFNYLFLESVLLNFFVFVLENWPPLYMYLEFWQIVLFSKCESGCLTIKHKLNREEKSLHHVAMVAKFLDDNKLIKSLKSLFALFQTSPILLNWLILVKLFSLGPYLSTSKFRKRKRQFLCCVHLLHKAGSWNLEVSCASGSGATTGKKCTK